MHGSYSAMSADNNTTGFSKAISHEKNERVARASLNDILVFQKSVEKEMKKLTEKLQNGTDVDKVLLHKMRVVEEQYLNVLDGFRQHDDNSQKHALIVYADAVQDLISHLHRHGVPQ